ncbi:MAG: hypothetical protein FWE24_08130 [Defluviitaleaceae bacterium]|nr:hypothetical protein [Defluviitaleaceae bacterium]
MKKVLRYLTAAMVVGLLVSMGGLHTHAAPANPFPFTFYQADGSQITLFFRGDEFFSWWETPDGFVTAYDETSGNWRYAEVYNGQILPLGQNIGVSGAARIQRDSILPLIEAGWRFDPGNPMIEFLNGEVLIDHREAAVTASPVATPAPIINIPIQPIQPGQPLLPPTIPDFPNIMQPPGGSGGSGVTDGTGPQPTPTPTPGTGGGVLPSFAVRTTTFNQTGPSFGPPMPAMASSNMVLAANAATHIQTNQRLLVLMIEFDDMPMVEDSAFYHNKYFNTAPGAISVANYFRDMSGGRNIFVPAGNVTTGGTFDANGLSITITPSTHSGVVRAHVHTNHPVRAWANPTGHETVRDTVSAVLAAVYENTNFDFGGVQVAAIFAGGEAADGGYNPGGHIWAHAWQYRGSYVGQAGWPRYMAYGERQRGGHVMGIGTAVHELGHVLGLPDLYDITGQSEGIGPYSVMAFGNWGRGPQDVAAGHRPTAFDPWSLIQLGYIRPTIISEGQWRGNVNSFNSGNHNVLMVTSPASSTQYFLVENRHMDSTWDAGLSMWVTNPNTPGGIIIFHVDDAMWSEDPSVPRRNNNNAHHLMVDVREADGSNLLAASIVQWGAKQDHFFSAGQFNTFGADTNPNSHFHSGSGNPGGRNVATGVEIIVHSNRGDVMEVEINLESSGGALGPRIIGSMAGISGTAAMPQFAGSVAPQNHARIQNQIALGANIPTLTIANDAAFTIYAETLAMLVANASDLAINSNTNSLILPTSLLGELLDAGGRVYSITVATTGDGVHISITADGIPVVTQTIS